MSDMSKAIVPKSSQLNSDDLLAGPRTIEITKVVIKEGTEQPVSVFFVGDGGKPYMACKSMCRVMVEAWGPDANKYVGHRMTLYRDEKVTWAGLAVGGIRISHMSHIEKEKTMVLTATKQTRKPFTVKPLVMKEITKEVVTEQPVVDQALLQAGSAAADKGVADYTTWLGLLSADEKASIKHLHAGWTKTAKSKEEGV